MRQYLIGSWNNADSYDYSGEQLMGNRLGASREVPHFLVNGRANVGKYGDNVAKPTKAPLVDRVLPQQRRVRVLTEQLYELEAERKNGLDIRTYSQLRDVLIVKRDRAELLLQKALSVKPNRPETYEDEGVSSYASSYPPSDNNGHGESYSSPVGVSFIDELSNDNSFKKILQKACVACKTLVRWHKATRNYIKTLQEV